MSTSRYGQPILLSSLASGAHAVPLDRISLTKTPDAPAFTEAWLQSLIMEHPGILPLSQIEAGYDSMVPICRELPLNVGFVDNLFITPSGNIAIVECKLWRNPEARRKVIAQILEYASELSTLSYEQLESAVLKGQRSKDLEEKCSLFEMVHPQGTGDEATFHDALTKTLQRGRFVLLILGDGIREGLESMADYLQQHAALHFRLSLVEVDVFEAPNNTGFFVQSRILAKTTNINRATITIERGQVEVKTPAASSVAKPLTISAETFYEKLDSSIPDVSCRLRSLVAEAEAFGVRADFAEKTLTFRWLTDTKNWNLGTIATNGEFWTDYHAQQARNLNLSQESREYLQTLADLSHTATVKQSTTGAWNLRNSGHGALTIAPFLTPEASKGLLRAIYDFQRKVLAKTGE